MTVADNDRYVLADAGHEGGVLLDLHTGDFSALNGTAAYIWTRALAGEPRAEIAAQLAARFTISGAEAERAVSASLAAGGPRPALARAYDPYLYEVASGGGYRLSFEGAPVLRIAADGSLVRLAEGFRADEARLRLHLGAVATKVLSLLGVPVLHAAAVRTPIGVLAFAGPSEAGKTTTARAFVACGSAAVCDDMMVLRPLSSVASASSGRHGEEAFVVVGGERAIGHWARAAARDLARGAEVVNTESLGAIAGGATARLARIGFLHRAPSAGGAPRVDLKPIAESEAVAFLLRQLFHGSSEPAIWRSQLETARRLALACAVVVCEVPDGLDSLAAAVAAYSEKDAS